MQLAINANMIGLKGRVRLISELDDIDALVRTYRPRLLRFVAFSTGDQDLAETVVQDCLLKAYNGRQSFRGECSVNTWLTGIAMNLIRDHQRTEKFRFWRTVRRTAIDVTEMASFLPSRQSSQEAQLLAQEQARQVAETMADLSMNQRSIFLMRFSEEMSVQEISEAIGMPVNTVKTHLHRAVKAVRARVGGRS